MSRILLMSLVFCAAISAIALGASQTLTLKDGRKVTGDVTKTDAGYRVKTDNGDVEFKANEVESLADSADLDKEYQDRLGKIDDKDANAHFELARWAERNGRLDIAKKELKRSLEISPDNEQAQLLLRKVEAGLTSTNKPEVPTATKATIGGPTDAKDLVSDDDINRIRLAELRDDDNASIEFKNKAFDRFIESQRGTENFHEKEFRKMSRAKQVRYILDTPGSGGVRDDIVIKSDPKFMMKFRSIWPGIEQNCGSAACHGGPKGKGEFKLFTRGSAKNDRVDYTNFLILNLWEKDGQHLMDRDHVEDSLVLQYGLPSKDAQYRHPADLNKTMFASKKTSNYKSLEAYIKELQGGTTPEYGTKYQPPVGRKLGTGAADSQPSSKPAKAE